jgi:hypothetical protein
MLAVAGESIASERERERGEARVGRRIAEPVGSGG